MMTERRTQIRPRIVMIESPGSPLLSPLSTLLILHNTYDVYVNGSMKGSNESRTPLQNLKEI